MSSAAQVAEMMSLQVNVAFMCELNDNVKKYSVGLWLEDGAKPSLRSPATDCLHKKYKANGLNCSFNI